MRIINYSIRGLIVVLGILIATGVILEDFDTQMRIVFGSVFILFGLYRLTMYYSQEKRYKFLDEEDDEN
ncbi:MAG: hypothetical protein KIT33_05785 [Candidatus Kapabacteria bacterium]|nr:hypothetical protein [Ignavibacteriota bacterium]MCW5884466.1 hypothetical protein [Candidatus Kapabacteria bacterium]